MTDVGFTCRGCGERHEGIPAFHAEAPYSYDRLTDAERGAIAELSSDQCVIKRDQGTEYYVRGLIEIPVHGHDDPFVWGVWVSLSEESFKRASELWATQGRESEPPFFGWLNTALPIYPSTVSMKTMVHTRPVGQRPSVVLERSDHPLALQQRDGIPLERLQEIVEQVLHGDPE